MPGRVSKRGASHCRVVGIEKEGHRSVEARPRYLRWGLMEAAIAASSHPLYKQRWYMLTRNKPLAPAGATCRLTA